MKAKNHNFPTLLFQYLSYLEDILFLDTLDFNCMHKNSSLKYLQVYMQHFFSFCVPQKKES